ncbi:MAG: hypothetical protein LBQ62_08815 [Candidatus Accumulibacter sp.]|jgi:type II secretory pathway pseudopilin PulG|nr:hypothetical protein [Accumulibacter sp.]
MNAGRCPGCPPPRAGEGAALLIVLLAMVLALSAALMSTLAGSNLEIERQRKSFEALAQAKQALIAWSVMQGDLWPPMEIDKNGVEKPTYRRPGVLPCPDTNFFGDSNSGNASGSCSAGGGTSIGRLPWKSLRIGEDSARDAHGEVLWYALSDGFRGNTSLNAAAINSDSKGTLLLYAANGSTLLTPPGEELAAIIFAPGAPLPGQDRTTALPNAAASYLEAFDGKNNASAAGPFIAGPVKDASGDRVVNDLVIGISARELIAVVEKRALKEAQNALSQFAALPNPASPAGANCVSPVSNIKSASLALCASDGATCAGRLPEDRLEPYVAPWFIQNGWGRVMIYALNDGVSCTDTLKAGGKTPRYLLFAPGAARAGQRRPSSLLADYLDDPANTDGWSGNLDFAAPEPDSNDQLRTMP